MASVARRVPEFGTLKALGWRSSRIVSQVLGESVGTGIVGGAAGVGLGFAGVAIIDKIAPKLSANVPSANGGGRDPVAGGQRAGVVARRQPHHDRGADVRLGDHRRDHPGGAPRVAGGLLAGSFGGWRAARLRPAAALARVA